MISIEKFCELHDACSDGREWALANCNTMADVWATACPGRLVWVATRPGVLDDRMLRLFAIDCARSVDHLLADDSSRRAIDVAERFANGDATLGELIEARAAGRDAAMVAASAGRDAARAEAAWAAWDAAMDASRDAAWAAWDAAWAAWVAASAARAEAAWERQAIWLRQHCTPNFAMGGE